MRKKILYIILSVSVCFISFVGCSSPIASFFSYEDSYDSVYEKDETLQYGDRTSGMAEDLVVIPKEKQTNKKYKRKDLSGAICVNLDEKEALERYKVYKKVYPASITKVMTALVVLKNADFDDVVTVGENIKFKEDDAVQSSLKKGDSATVRELFNALLVHSTNDASIILAEYIAGSEEKFVEMMNEEARRLGATGTHFENSHGLHQEDHYTTPYDIYLFFQEACEYEQFMDVVEQSQCEFVYTDADGEKQVERMESSNQYFTGEREKPEGVKIFGGKTGTTDAAGSCLVLLTENKDGDKLITAVLGAEDKDDLYRDMSELISKRSKK